MAVTADNRDAIGPLKATLSLSLSLCHCLCLANTPYILYIFLYIGYITYIYITIYNLYPI